MESSPMRVERQLAEADDTSAFRDWMAQSSHGTTVPFIPSVASPTPFPPIEEGDDEDGDTSDATSGGTLTSPLPPPVYDDEFLKPKAVVFKIEDTLFCFDITYLVHRSPPIKALHDRLLHIDTEEGTENQPIDLKNVTVRQMERFLAWTRRLKVIPHQTYRDWIAITHVAHVLEMESVVDECLDALSFRWQDPSFVLAIAIRYNRTNYIETAVKELFYDNFNNAYELAMLPLRVLWLVTLAHDTFIQTRNSVATHVFTAKIPALDCRTHHLCEREWERLWTLHVTFPLINSLKNTLLQVKDKLITAMKGSQLMRNKCGMHQIHDLDKHHDWVDIWNQEEEILASVTEKLPIHSSESLAVMSSKLILAHRPLERHKLYYEDCKPYLVKVDNTLFWVDRALFAGVSDTWNNLFEKETPVQMSKVGTVEEPAEVVSRGALTAKMFKCLLRWMRFGGSKTYTNEDLFDIMAASDYWIIPSAQDFVFASFEGRDVPTHTLLDLACRYQGGKYLRCYVERAFMEAEPAEYKDIHPELLMQLLRGRRRIDGLKMKLGVTPPIPECSCYCTTHGECVTSWNADWSSLISGPLFRDKDAIQLRNVVDIMERKGDDGDDCRRMTLNVLKGRRAEFLQEKEVVDSVVLALSSFFSIILPEE
ncbi:hypothetical protein CVT24_011302 [Panaeolus cyanescens]|uniref:BTB domain-containing protein n=1 Tax=Panaeolus cyanescens TaxID=181874 RepID=A0A409WE60_9AGAR|nr:hypothetical protein CVT24_011302 [Panaeolus cyanescens]